mgnify:CR=1 FL=1
MEFRTRKDRWLVVLLLLMVIFCGVGGLMLLAEPGHKHLPVAILCLVFSGASVFLMYPVRYTLAERELVVRGGPFRWRVAYENIEKVTPTRNPLAAPAWSLSRLRVDHRYRGRTVFLLISPERQEEFLRELAGRCPHLMLSGDRLVKAPAPLPPANLPESDREKDEGGGAKAAV